ARAARWPPRSAGSAGGPPRRADRRPVESYSPVASVRQPERSVSRREARPGGSEPGAAGSARGRDRSARYRGPSPSRAMSLNRRARREGADRVGSACRPDGQPSSPEPNPYVMPHSVMDGRAGGLHLAGAVDPTASPPPADRTHGSPFTHHGSRQRRLVYAGY